MLVIAGLSNEPDRNKPGFDDRAAGSWLTGCEPAEGRVQVGISMDQIAAQHFSKQTPFGSLELATELARVSNGTPYYRDAQTI